MKYAQRAPAGVNESLHDVTDAFVQPSRVPGGAAQPDCAGSVTVPCTAARSGVSRPEVIMNDGVPARVDVSLAGPDYAET